MAVCAGYVCARQSSFVNRDPIVLRTGIVPLQTMTDPFVTSNRKSAASPVCSLYPQVKHSQRLRMVIILKFPLQHTRLTYISSMEGKFQPQSFNTLWLAPAKRIALVEQSEELPKVGYAARLVHVLCHTNPCRLWSLKWPSIITRLIDPITCSLMSDRVICKHKKERCQYMTLNTLTETRCQ